MGTASSKKIIKQVSGVLTEEAALLTSAGAGDANRLPALNAFGVLDSSLVNGTTTSAGSADVGKIPLLDASGRIDTTVLPVGIGADTLVMTTSEAISAGDFVNIWDSTGPKVRKADASTPGKEAHGFVLAGAGSGGTVTVYFEGTNTGVTGMTPGKVYLSPSPAGHADSTPPTTAGHFIQRIGVAVSATAISFEAADPITLA